MWKYFDWLQNRRPVYFCCCQFPPIFVGRTLIQLRAVRSSEFSFQLWQAGHLPPSQQLKSDQWLANLPPPTLESDPQTAQLSPLFSSQSGSVTSQKPYDNGSTGNWDLGGGISSLVLHKCWKLKVLWWHENTTLPNELYSPMKMIWGCAIHGETLKCGFLRWQRSWRCLSGPDMPRNLEL